MTDLRALLPPPGRTNTSTLYDDHPDDHNEIIDAVNELAAKVADFTGLAGYRSYANKAARDADVGAHVEGMLAWAAAELTLSLWHGAWTVIREPPVDFTPTVKLGSETLTIDNLWTAWYRRDYGVCTYGIFVVTASPSGGSPADVLTIDPPLTPTSQGGAGIGFCLTDTVPGAIGIATLVDPTRMAILKPPTGLLTRADLNLGTPSQVQVFSAGQYATGAFEE